MIKAQYSNPIYANGMVITNGKHIETTLTKNSVLKLKDLLYIAICTLEKEVIGNCREATINTFPKPLLPTKAESGSENKNINIHKKIDIEKLVQKATLVLFSLLLGSLNSC